MAEEPVHERNAQRIGAVLRSTTPCVLPWRGPLASRGEQFDEFGFNGRTRTATIRDETIVEAVVAALSPNAHASADQEA